MEQALRQVQLTQRAKSHKVSVSLLMSLFPRGRWENCEADRETVVVVLWK